MATSVVNPRVQFFANNGRPLIGGRIHTYVAGSSTRARTYKDAAKDQPNTNPIVLDGRGEAQIYLAEGVEYKFVVEDSKGALIYTQEPVYGAVWPNAADWPSDATLAYQYMTEAKAAAGAIGPIKFYDTYAQAMGDLPNLADGDLVEVSRDETMEGARTRYRVESGALAFLINLDILRSDLANPAQGASLVAYKLSASAAAARTAAGKFGEITSALDFYEEEHGDDYFPAIQSAIDYASVVIRVGSEDSDIVTASIYIPAGIYRTTQTIQLKNGVQLYGAGSGATALLIDHAGHGVESAAGRTYANVHVVGISLISLGSAIDGVVGVGLLRNCLFRDVVCRGFRNNFYLADTWTTRIEQCMGLEAKNSQIYCAEGTGGVHIYGGRFDVMDGHGVFMDSVTGELIMHDVAVQFGKKSAVNVVNARTVELDQCFFEGNCIGNPSNYYVELRRSGANALSSAVVNNCVMNNRADANRNGLGVCYVENFRMFTYRERWTRNGSGVVPVVGAGVEQVYADYATATASAPILGNIAWDSSNHAFVRHTARPFGFYGEDMLHASFAPTTRAAMNVGLPGIGLAMGTYNQIPAIQSYGSAQVLLLNPGGGEVRIGSAGATVAGGTNEFFGRTRKPTGITSTNSIPTAVTGYALVDCSAGGRSCTLTDIAHSPGREVIIGKRDGTTNPLTIIPGSGVINGGGVYVLNTAYKHVKLISDGVNWFAL